MPDWKTHFIFSLFLVIFWILFFQFADFLKFRLDFKNLVTLIVFTIFASLFPDVDMKGSRIRDTLSLTIAAFAAGLYVFFYTQTWYYAPFYFVLLYLILKYLPTKHRGVTHTFKFSVLFSIVFSSVYFVFSQFMFDELILWFAIIFSSYNLHIAIDRM